MPPAAAAAVPVLHIQLRLISDTHLYIHTTVQTCYRLCPTSPLGSHTALHALPSIFQHKANLPAAPQPWTVCIGHKRCRWHDMFCHSSLQIKYLGPVPPTGRTSNYSNTQGGVILQLTCPLTWARFQRTHWSISHNTGSLLYVDSVEATVIDGVLITIIGLMVKFFFLLVMHTNMPIQHRLATEHKLLKNRSRMQMNWFFMGKIPNTPTTCVAATEGYRRWGHFIINMSTRTVNPAISGCTSWATSTPKKTLDSQPLS